MILYLLGILIYAVPGVWVNYTLNKHDDVLPNMPFTAKEFGLNLLKEQNLDEVNIAVSYTHLTLPTIYSV